MSNLTWVLDNGHGGLIERVYQTEGKRSPVWDDGSQLFEGEFNRDIVKKLLVLCRKNNIDCVELVPELEDISLKERVRRVNELYETNKRIVLVSIHANAGGGTGYEVFTYKGESFSDKMANIFFDEVKQTLPTVKLRPDYTDGDPDKEASFYLLKYTKCPAILTENFFMDREWPDCKYYLMTQEGREIIANYHFRAIKRVENYVKIHNI